MYEPQLWRRRSVKAHQAILEASAELLLEKGLAAVSMDAVAARAGVSKATIYRWWPTKETLALDTLYNEWAAVPPPPPPPGPRPAGGRPWGRVPPAVPTDAQPAPAPPRQYRACFVEPRRD